AGHGRTRERGRPPGGRTVARRVHREMIPSLTFDVHRQIKPGGPLGKGKAVRAGAEVTGNGGDTAISLGVHFPAESRIDLDHPVALVSQRVRLVFHSCSDST